MGIASEAGVREGAAGLGRRAFDILAASLLIVGTLPLLVAGAVAVLLSDGRPILFGHRRLGRGRSTFRCWKLRTMRRDAEQQLANDPGLRRRHREAGFKLAVSEDPRLIGTGAWLRRSRIDELPQLWNVLVGDMSLLGPRPIVEEELAFYGDDADNLLTVRPGLFGAWNSLGRRAPSYPERAALELAYVRERSLSWDLLILGRSLFALLEGERRR